MKRIYTYIQLWLMLAKNSFLSVLTVRFSFGIFLVAKALRFCLYYLFLLSLFSHFQSVNGYQKNELLFAFMTFVVIDTLVQLCFREVYRFRPLVISGDFDLILVKPMSALFRVLLGGADLIDLLLFVPYLMFLVISMVHLPLFSLQGLLVYAVFVCNSICIAMGFHIIVLSLTIITSEIDHTIMIYRDITSMGRIPVDIYQEPFRTVITYILPVGIMMTFPVKAFLQTLSYGSIVVAFAIGIGFLLSSLFIWKRTILGYTSASS